MAWRVVTVFILHTKRSSFNHALHPFTLHPSREALQEAVELFFATASELGSLSDILAEAGYEYQDGLFVISYKIAPDQ